MTDVQPIEKRPIAWKIHILFTVLIAVLAYTAVDQLFIREQLVIVSCNSLSAFGSSHIWNIVTETEGKEKHLPKVLLLFDENGKRVQTNIVYDGKFSGDCIVKPLEQAYDKQSSNNSAIPNANES